MPPVSLGFAKNVARRAFLQIVDPAPNREHVDLIWEYFGGRCAYCHLQLDRTRKEGHVDHLDSASAGGSNHVSNRVLACARCNEHEKRDTPWDEFLLAKAGDVDTYRARAAHILAWRRKHAVARTESDGVLLAQAESAARDVAELIDRLASALRAERKARRAERAKHDRDMARPQRAVPRASGQRAGQDSIVDADGANAGSHSGPIARPAASETSRAERDAVGIILNAAMLSAREVSMQRVRCPGCDRHVFAQWPAGWDAHAAHRCAGVSGADPVSRKVEYRARFGRLFRPETQRAAMQRIWTEVDGDRERAVQRWMSAERSGEIVRASDAHGTSADAYARALIADGLRKRWL